MIEHPIKQITVPNKELFILDNIILYFIPRTAPTISRRIDSGTKKRKKHFVYTTI